LTPRYGTGQKILGNVSCIDGNVPLSILQLSTPAEVTAYCQELNKKIGGNGGFILMNGAAIDDVKAENMRAFVNSVK
jgi:uroporphyrinogen-III decarboxylase